ncbi:MAG: alpha-galactosidase [Abditibacteriota bacterium]|nr:alpha-galactosidase [Abditibacteriota bacterium]
MSKVFTVIGGGSFGFTTTLVRDLLTFPAFRDAELRLMDINEKRMGFVAKRLQQIKEAGNYPCTIKTFLNDRRAALDGADGVVCTILQGGPEIFRTDIEIPYKYGVDINIGDTRGPSGIFRALRTIPIMLDICKDIEEICPKAIFLNYTNPMAMLCNAMQKSYPNLSVTGLCHSVQGTAHMLAEWLGVDMKDVTYLCAGVNHQAHYLKFEVKGEDAYPSLRKVISENEEILNKEQVRNEMFLKLGYYVTESSGHNSEYVAWFRKRKDLIEKYCTTGTNWNPGEHAYILNEYLKNYQNFDSITEEELKKEIDLKRGQEYATQIFNAIFGDNTPFKFNGNIPNKGLIDNLPYDCCVEVPVWASKDGLEGIKVGALPDQLALLNNITARCEELAVKGALEGDKTKVYHACLFDPLTSAVLSMDEIKNMVDEMFEANKDYLGYFKD